MSCTLERYRHELVIFPLHVDGCSLAATSRIAFMGGADDTYRMSDLMPRHIEYGLLEGECHDTS
jgi:hypothetical protein